jgi:hypothetical protein
MLFGAIACKLDTFHLAKNIKHLDKFSRLSGLWNFFLKVQLNKLCLTYIRIGVLSLHKCSIINFIIAHRHLLAQKRQVVKVLNDIILFRNSHVSKEHTLRLSYLIQPDSKSLASPKIVFIISKKSTMISAKTDSLDKSIIVILSNAQEITTFWCFISKHRRYSMRLGDIEP